MDIKLHKQATTTPKIRAEIQAAPAHITDTARAERFDVSDMTIRRWRNRNDVYDRPPPSQPQGNAQSRAGRGADCGTRIPSSRARRPARRHPVVLSPHTIQSGAPSDVETPPSAYLGPIGQAGPGRQEGSAQALSTLRTGLPSYR